MGLYNRGDFGSIHGWGAVHSVAWNVDSAGQYIYIQKPSGAQNYAIGNHGIVSGKGIYNHPAGLIQDSNIAPTPLSLYRAQLNERLKYGIPSDALARLTVSDHQENQLSLNWYHSSVKETRFIIERSSDGGNLFEVIDLTEESDSSYIDNKIGGKMYTYRVRVEDSNGLSAYSNTASGEAIFTNEYITDIHPHNPSDETEIQIDGDPDNTLTFEWDIKETELDIEFTLMLDKPLGDFSDPITEIRAGINKDHTITYRQLINYLQVAEIIIDSEYGLK